MLMVAGEPHSVEKWAGFGIGIDIVCVSNHIAVLLHVSAGFKGDLVITVKHYTIAFIGANDDVACFKITCINHVSIIVGRRACSDGHDCEQADNHHYNQHYTDRPFDFINH